MSTRLNKVLHQQPSFCFNCDPDLGKNSLFCQFDMTPPISSMQSIEIYFLLGSLPSLPVSTSLTSTLTRYKKPAMLASKRVARGREGIHFKSITTQQPSCPLHGYD